MLKGFKMRGDVSLLLLLLLLLSPEQMGGLAMQLNVLARSLLKYSKENWIPSLALLGL
jgi:hypothetical protein